MSRFNIPTVEFLRPCALCPHMKRITLSQDPSRAGNDGGRGDDRSGHRRVGPPRRRKDAGVVTAERLVAAVVAS